MAGADDANEIAQVSFYLAKPHATFESLIDPDSDLKGQPKFQQHDFDVGDASCRFFYFETAMHKKNPPWLDFVNSQLKGATAIAFAAQSRSANGILLMQVNRRVFAAIFGRSAGKALVRAAIEPDFGIKTAMNLCGNEEIRQTRTQNNTLTPTHIDRQVSKPSETFVFGLSEAEDLKFISAHIKGNPNVTLQGRDSLTVKVTGDERLNWDRLIAQCRSFLKAYGSKAYVELFPNYRNFREAADAEVLALDAALIAKLRAAEFDDIQLCVPEFLADDEFSFSYTDNAARENHIFSHLDPDQLHTEVMLANITIARLKAKRIYAYSHVDDRVLSDKRWSLYDCLVFEHKLGKKSFILNDGRWLEVDAAFYAAILEFMKKRLHIEPCEALFAGIAINDDKALKNEEGIFNQAACKKKKNSVLFDRAKLRIGHGPRNKEFCDLLDFADDGKIRIINCKQLKGASSVNYLFSQTQFYCESFLRDEPFLAEIRAHIQASDSATKDEYLRHIPAEAQHINAKDFRVCLWLLYDRHKAPPTWEDIPLIAQYELKLMHDYLSRVCKFSDIVLRFIPVGMVNFSRKATPKKAA